MATLSLTSGIRQCGRGDLAKASGSRGGGRSAGGGAAAGEANAIDENAYDKSLSEFNALGTEKSYAGVSQDPSNSRIFGIQRELKFWDQQPANQQASYIDSLMIQMSGVGNTGNPRFIARANGDTMKLWNQTSADAKRELARQIKPDYNTGGNPALKNILKDLEQYR